jgi:hypothetical protein
MRAKNFIFCWSVIILALFLANSCQNDTPESVPLEILKDEYPGSFFFRRPVAMTDLEFTQWDSLYNRLSGIIGKTLNEEIPGSSAAIDYYERFKKAHPEQMVLLHFNGNSKDPNDPSGNFHASHWLYYEGCELSEDIKAEKGQYEIKVSDPGMFYTSIGRYKNVNDDIGICRKTEDGKPDWDYSEHVQLVSINHEQKSIVVNRAMYGSEALDFTAGETLVCPHVSEGPWGGENNNLLWLYNRSSLCPKDKNGKMCIDILSDYMAEQFSEGGRLQYYDGVEFDVLWNDIRPQTFGRLADANGDGIGDGGIIEGINTVYDGTDIFCKLLREKLGPYKLILSDGFTPVMQTSVKYLNGIESEGWPLHADTEVRDWSGGWNRHLFWNQNAFEPHFGYVNFKYMGGVEPPPLPRQRLVWAAAQLMSVKIAHGGLMRAGEKALTGEYYTSGAWKGDDTVNFKVPAIDIIDEFIGGELQEKYWLGRPLEESVRLALKKHDVLEGGGINISSDFLSRFSGEAVSFSRESNELEIEGSTDNKMRFSMDNIMCAGPDLLISFEVKGNLVESNPERPRLLNLWSSENNYKLMTWVNDEWFTATFYFRDIVKNNINIFFEAQTGEKIFIKNLTAHAYPDVICREFENGLVLANPSHHPYTFNLAAISPGRKYKRLTATAHQDNITNNGNPVADSVSLGERSGLFLLVDE